MIPSSLRNLRWILFKTDLLEGSEGAVILLLCYSVMACLFSVNGTTFAFHNTLTGMGYSTHAVFSGVCELLGRSFGDFWQSNRSVSGMSVLQPLWHGFLLWLTVAFRYDTFASSDRKQLNSRNDE